MPQATQWDQTIKAEYSLCEPENQPGQGRLVRIHPLDINSGLLTLPSRPFIIGRDEEVDLKVNDCSVSRAHAVIEPTPLGFIVTDLGSTNGTYVNEQRVLSQLLAAGDRLRTGKHIFKFLSSDDVESQYHETIYSMMTRDGLTGAYNKRYLMDVLSREIERSQRHQRPLSMMMIDIDHFKIVNDSYGHLAGDEVLQELCRRVMQILRKDEVFARFGGEEFSLVMGEAVLDAAEQTAERCRALIENEPFHTSAGPVAITASFGVAQLGSSDTSAVQLLAAADAKLFEAKKDGRNCVCR